MAVKGPEKEVEWIMKKDEIFIRDYSYELPNEQIAHHPLPKRDESRLLVYKSGRIEETHFYQLADRLPESCVLILNNTKVIEARLFFSKATGGVIEIFCLEPYRQSMEISLQSQGSAEWLCMIGGASKWKPGQVLSNFLQLDGEDVVLEARYKGKVDDAFIIEFSWQPTDLHFIQLLHAAGAIPLPPYIKRSAELVDKERYQTIFAEREGSVAAPTAALHFTEEVFNNLRQKNILPYYITLNVGAGTFKPVKAETISGHSMHSETFSVRQETLKAILNAEAVVAVGTTSLRTLESLHWMGVKLLQNLLKEWTLGQWEHYELDDKFTYQESLAAVLDYMIRTQTDELHCRTSLLIVPGYEFKIPSALVTNFHQPQSTLLLLIAAFIGDDWKKVYQYALDNGFRFLSYGDSSLLWRAAPCPTGKTQLG